MMSRLFVLATAAVAVAAKDVPVGECHKCESYCMEDCVANFYGEVIQGERRDAELKQRMVDKHGSGHASARGLAGVALVQSPDAPVVDQKQVVNAFVDCLATDKCPTHPGPGCSLNATQSNTTNKTALIEKKQCVTGDQPCTSGCVAKAVQQTDSKAPSFMQRNLRKSSGFPHAPVKRGAFASGKMTLDECMKSCLAVTCGCSSAPGFEKINKLFKQIKKNENHGEPVADTPPSWQFEAASQQECANGIPGKKIKSGLFANIGGSYNEICTKDYFDKFYGPAWPQMKSALKKCKSGALDDQKFGCSWNGADCVFAGTTPALPCFKRFKRDPSL